MEKGKYNIITLNFNYIIQGENMSKEFEVVVLKKLDELSTELKHTKQELKDFAKDTNQRLINLEEGQQDTNERLGKVELGLKDTNEIVIDLKQRLENVELGLKDNKENIVSLNVKNYNHNTRISNLENKDLSFAKA